MLEQGKKKRAWHMLDHAWELEDRDLTNGPAQAHRVQSSHAHAAIGTDCGPTR